MRRSWIARHRWTTAAGARRAVDGSAAVLRYLLYGGRDLVSDEIIVRELLEALERRRRARFPAELDR